MSGWNNRLPIGQSLGELYGGLGGISTLLLNGYSSLCTDRRAISTYKTVDSQELRTSMLATTPILVSKLATACVFCCRPTTSNSLTVPSLSPKNLSVPTISSNKGSYTHRPHRPHRLRQWKYETSLLDGIDHIDGLSFLTSLYASGFYPLILFIAMYLFGFEKLVISFLVFTFILS